MDKDAIADLIENKHSNYIKWGEAQPEEHWTRAPETKWTTGQYTLHLIDSLKLMN